MMVILLFCVCFNVFYLLVFKCADAFKNLFSKFASKEINNLMKNTPKSSFHSERIIKKKYTCTKYSRKIIVLYDILLINCSATVITQCNTLIIIINE